MREPVDATRVRTFMEAVARSTKASCRVYFLGGVSAVLEGWRRETVDVDMHLVPDSDPLLRAIPNIKDSLNISVELASPAHFIPEVPGWQDRSRFIDRIGSIDFFQYDFYSQALSKIARGLDKDLKDVAAMVARGLVEPPRAWALFRSIEPQLYRYPRLDPATFHQAVEAALGREGRERAAPSDRDSRGSS